MITLKSGGSLSASKVGGRMSLSLSTDAAYLVACAEEDAIGKGACWFFVADGDNYKQQGGKFTSGLTTGCGWFGEYTKNVV